jgi:hypothetical protein
MPQSTASAGRDKAGPHAQQPAPAVTPADTRRRGKRVKPEKPYEDFPLFPHATRRWAKKIRGQLRSFGPWEDWQGTLAKYQEQKDDPHAGRTPRVQKDGFTVRDLVNRFLTSKKLLHNAGELTPRTFGEYHATCALVGDAFGLTRLVDDLASDDFEKLRARLAKTRGPVALGNEIRRIRSVFKYAWDAGLVDRPVRFGPGFSRPSRKTLRKARAARGEQFFEPAELRKVLDAAGPQLRAMILLGINCGFGNADVGTLPLEALDLERGWVNYPRPKTGIPRRCSLWPETVEALRSASGVRPRPKRASDAGLVFLTRFGGPWFKGTPDNPCPRRCGGCSTAWASTAAGTSTRCGTPSRRSPGSPATRWRLTT